VRGVTYRNVRQVLETNPLEPGSREFKYYAPGVGLIRIEEGLDRNLGNPELVFNLVPGARRGAAAAAAAPPVTAPVPLPAPLGLLLVGLAALAGVRRRFG
jgi:hypothetical protein